MQRDHHAEVEGEQVHEQHHDQRHAERLGAPDVSEPGPHEARLAHGLALHVELIDPHRHQGSEHPDVGHRVQEERRPQAEVVDHRPGDRATQHASSGEDGAVQADGVRDVLLPDQLDVERLARRRLEREDQPRQEGDHEDHPDLDDVRGDERELDPCEHGVARVRPDQDAALVEPIGQRPRPYPEEQDRQEQQSRLDPQGDATVRELQHEDSTRGPVHPRAGDRDQCPTKNSRKFLEMCIEANVFRISSARRDMHPDYEARQQPLFVGAFSQMTR